MPEGFEVFEDPERGQVYLRKTKPTRILAAERGLLEVELRRAGVLHFRVEIDGDSLIVYVADAQPHASDDVLHVLAEDRAHAWEVLMSCVPLVKMLRFDLIDEDRQLDATVEPRPLVHLGSRPDTAREPGKLFRVDVGHLVGRIALASRVERASK